MNAKTLRTLSVSGAVAALLIAASPAWAHHERHFGHGPRYVHQYRAAVVVAPPVVSYRYAPAPVYYVQRPAYVPAPAYYVAQPAYVLLPPTTGRLRWLMPRWAQSVALWPGLQ